MAINKIDTAPLTLKEINPILDYAIEQARQISEPIFLCLASPTGFDSQLWEYFNNENPSRNFHSLHLSVCLLDLETGNLIYNSNDEVTNIFISLCDLEFHLEKLEKLRKFLNRLLDKELVIKEFVRFDQVLIKCNTDGFSDEYLIKRVFNEYAEKQGYKLQIIKDVGLTMTNFKK